MDLRPYLELQTIYILPLSADPERYRVIYPEFRNRFGRRHLDTNLAERINQGKLLIRQFKSCTSAAAAAIKRNLGGTVKQRLLGQNLRANQLLVAGVVVFIVGIIDWTFPDPLPLVDEIILTGAGGLLAYLGYTQKKRYLPSAKEQVERALRDLDDLVISEDPLLSRIHDSLEAGVEDEPGHDSLAGADQRADWLLKYVNVQELIRSGAATEDEVRQTMGALSDVFPLRKLAEAEGHVERWRRRIGAAAQKHTISEAVLSVYVEFFKSAQEHFGGRELLYHG